MLHNSIPLDRLSKIFIFVDESPLAKVSQLGNIFLILFSNKKE